MKPKLLIDDKKVNTLINHKFEKLNIEIEKDKVIKNYACKKNKILLAIIEPLSGTEGDLDMNVLCGVDLIFDTLDIAKTKEIFILINTSGGSGYTYALAKAIRRLFNKITVFIPSIAASAGTVLALTGDEIVMGRLGHITPVDSQLCVKNGKDEKYVSMKAMSSGIKKLTDELRDKKDKAKSLVYKTMIGKIDLCLKDEYERSIMYDMMQTEELLYLSNYSRQQAHKIADKLVNGYPVHSYIIDYYEAKRLGLRVKQSKEYPEEWNLMKYWFLKYMDNPSSRIYVRYVV